MRTFGREEFVHVDKENRTNLEAKSKKCTLLPPKLYLVVFYQVSMVNRTRITCSDCKRPLEVLLGSACMFIPMGGTVINVLA